MLPFINNGKRPIKGCIVPLVKGIPTLSNQTALDYKHDT
jgi:hypothetical protein